MAQIYFRIYALMANSETNNQFGLYLRGLRKKRGLSQKRVALDAKLDQSYLAAIELGRRPPPRDRGLAQLADAVHASDEEKQRLFSVRSMAHLSRAANKLSPDMADVFLDITKSINALTKQELLAVKGLLAAMRDSRSDKEAVM